MMPSEGRVVKLAPPSRRRRRKRFPGVLLIKNIVRFNSVRYRAERLQEDGTHWVNTEVITSQRSAPGRVDGMTGNQATWSPPRKVSLRCMAAINDIVTFVDFYVALGDGKLAMSRMWEAVDFVPSSTLRGSENGTVPCWGPEIIGGVSVYGC